MFKSDKTKRTLIIAGVAFAVIYATLFLLIQGGFSVSTLTAIVENIFSVAAPILTGALIAYLLNPFLKFFERKIFKKMKRPRLRRALSVLLVYLLVLLILIGIFSAILPQVITSVQEFGSNITNYATALQSAVSSLFDDLNHYIDNHPSVRDLLESMRIYDWIGKIVDEDAETTIPNGSETDPVLPEEPSTDLPTKHELSFEAFSEFLMQKLSSLSSVFTEYIAKLANSLLDLSFSFFNFLKNIILGIFISIYLLLSKERVGAQLKRFAYAFFPKKAAEEALRITKYSDRTVGRFLLGTIIDAVIVSIVTLILLTICNIRYALLIALIIGITNMIPFFGPFIGAIPSALLLLIDDITAVINNPGEPAHFSFITFIIIVLVIQQIDGNIINPRVIGNSTGLSSLGVILSVTIMSGFFGFFGMLLGVPVAAIIIGLGKEIIEKRLEKKSLPIPIAEYYAANCMVPPETPEEEQEHHEHTAFYRWLIRLRDRVRHLFRRILYRNHGKSKSLRMWVKMKLSVRSVKHKVSHTLHHDSPKERQAQESEPKKESEEQNPASADTTEEPMKESDLPNNDTKEADSSDKSEN
jgi:predicted PurR-regulated permease PerM